MGTYKNDQLPDISSNPNIPIKETSNKSSEVLFTVELLLIIDEYMTHMNEEILRHQSIKAEIIKEKENEKENTEKEGDDGDEIGDVEDLLKPTLENGNLSNIEEANEKDKKKKKNPPKKKKKKKKKKK